MDRRRPGSPRKGCITARMRSMLTFASLALPFHSRQRRRSTSSTITAFAAARSGPSDNRPPAICVRCCSRMATLNSRPQEEHADYSAKIAGSKIYNSRKLCLGLYPASHARLVQRIHSSGKSVMNLYYEKFCKVFLKSLIASRNPRATSPADQLPAHALSEPSNTWPPGDYLRGLD